MLPKLEVAANGQSPQNNLISDAVQRDERQRWVWSACPAEGEPARRQLLAEMLSCAGIWLPA